MKKIFYNLLVFCITMAALLVVCEAALRVFYQHKDRSGFCVLRPNLRKVFHPAPGVMPGVSGESRFYVNSSGIRGEEFASSQKYRILTLGGSTTECLYLDGEKTWQGILHRKLNGLNLFNVWVGNAGSSGKTTRDNIMHMKYLLPQYPKIDTIIVLAGVNDLSLRLEMGKDYDPYFLNRPGSEQKQIEHAFYLHPFMKRRNPFENTAIYKLVRKARYLFLKRREVEDEAGKWYIEKRKERKNASEIINELPDLTGSLDEYGKNIDRMIDLARDRSVRMIFLTQPFMWRQDLNQNEKDLCLWGRAGQNSTKYYSFEALISGLERYNDKLIEVCKARGVEFIDMSKYMSGDASFFYDDVHFNEKGSARVAEIIFEYLKARKPFNQITLDEPLQKR